MQHPSEEDEEMFFQSARVASFRQKWPYDNVHALHLADAGWFYSKVRNCLRCPFCGVDIEMGDVPPPNPLRQHVMSNVTCPFVLGREPRDVPIYVELRRNPSCMDSIVHNKKMSEASLRNETFQTWTFIPELPFERLVDAGFYFLSHTVDYVRCYICGVTVGNWLPNDEPVAVHRKVSPGCYFERYLPPGKRYREPDITTDMLIMSAVDSEPVEDEEGPKIFRKVIESGD
ncbi:e3 ubiquitin-protein ligase xiap, partial [Lasius niger]